MVALLALAAATAPPESTAEADALADEAAAGCSSPQARFLRHRGKFIGSDGSAQRYAPPILWTVPGCGNTMVRMLLERATAVRTGSVQKDKRLIAAGFAGEGRVDHDVVVVKVHHAQFSSALPIRLIRPWPALNRTKVWRMLAVTSAIAVVRDPYNAFFAEYNLEHTPYGSHTAQIPRRKFHADDFARDGIRFAKLWNRTMHRYRDFSRKQCYTPTPFRNPNLGRELAVNCRLGMWTFEALTSRTRRLGVLRQMVGFLQLPPKMVPAEAQLECAFRLSDAAAQRIKRPHDDGGGAFVTRERAYSLCARTNPDFVCRFWHHVREHAEPMGYEPFGGAVCDGAR